MSGRRVATAVAVCILAAALALSPVGAWLTAHLGHASAQVTFDDDGLEAGPSTGTSGLYPGKSGAGQVQVTNHTEAEAVVTAISSATSEALGGCPQAAVASVARLDPDGLLQRDGSSRTIPPGSTATYAIEIGMDPDAPSGCAGRTFPLTVQIAGSPE